MTTDTSTSTLLAAVTAARAALREHKRGRPARLAELRAVMDSEESALSAHCADVVRAAAAAGASVSAISAAYGTKDRGTIYRIVSPAEIPLENAAEIPLENTAQNPASATPTTAPDPTDHRRTVVTFPASGTSVTVGELGEFLAGDRATWVRHHGGRPGAWFRALPRANPTNPTNPTNPGPHTVTES